MARKFLNGVNITGTEVIATAVTTSGIQTVLTVTGSADTNQTLSTEKVDVDFALNRTVQWATGALATQRAFVVRAPTYSFVGASTITTAATLAITGAPVAGTNATITNSRAFWVQAGASRFDDRVQMVLGTPTIGLTTGVLTLSRDTDGYVFVVEAPNMTSTPAFGLQNIPLSTDLNTGKAFELKVSGEGSGRAMFYSDGKFAVGSGGGARDTVLSRSAANTFKISSDGAAGAGHLEILGRLSVGGTLSTTTAISSPASTTAISSLRLPHGTAPTSPVDGDVWTTTTAMFVRVNGATVQLGSGGGTIGGSIAANQVAYGSGANTIQGAATLTYTSTTGLAIAQTSVSSGTQTAFLLTGAANTNMTLSTEVNDLDINLARTVQWATGALTTQRAVLLRAPTYAFVGASTITDAATFAITGAPVAGTNATITNRYAVLVETGNVHIASGNLSIVGTAGSPAISVIHTNFTSDIISGRYNAANPIMSLRIGASGTPVLNYNVDTAGNYSSSVSAFQMGGTASRPWALSVAVAGTVGNPVSLIEVARTSTTQFEILNAFSVAPVNVSSGTQTAFRLTGAANTNLTTATEVVDVDFVLNRTVQWATGAITTQRAAVIRAPTYAFVGASTITTAATLAITDAPIAGTNATITDRHALWIQAGSLALPLGTAALPSLAFGGDANTGLYSAGADQLNLSTGGTLRWSLSTTAITSTVVHQGPAGGAGAPTYSFSTDPNSGFYSAGADVVGFSVGGSTAFTIRAVSAQNNGSLNSNPPVQTSGSSCQLRVFPDNDTNQTASAEASSVIFDLSPVKQFATGALATQRAFRIAAPTYSFVGASTLTNAATVAISGAPVAGTNATITTSYALWVQAGLLGTAASTTTVAGLRIPHGTAPTSPVDGDMWTTSAGGLFARINGVTVNYSAGGGTIGGSITSNEIAHGSGANTIQGSSTFTYSLAAGLLVAPTGLSNGTAACSIAPSTVSTGGAYSLVVTAPTHSAIFSGNENPDVGFDIGRAGNTWQTGALTTQRFVFINIPTINFVGASTVTTAATFAIFGAPAAGTNATITNSLAMWVQNGLTRLDGGITVPGTFSAASNNVTTITALMVLNATVSGTIPVSGTVDTKPGGIVLTQALATANGASGSTPMLSLTGAAHNSLQAGTEYNHVLLNFGQSVQFATGAITTQRCVAITAPSYRFVAASTITTAATLAISGAPNPSTNASITNAHALWVEGGRSCFEGPVLLSGSSSVGGFAQFTISNNAAAGGVPKMVEWVAAAHTGMTASAEVSDITFNLARTVQWATGAITTQRAFRVQAPTYAFVGASTVTNAATLAISGAPVAGTNATLTNTYALWVQTGLLGTAASTTATAGLRLPHGTAPTSPVDGDIWTTTASVFARVNGATVDLAGGGSGLTHGQVMQRLAAF